jgi:hypothetical protein
MSTHIEFLEELNQLIYDSGYEDVILITETDDEKVFKLSWNINHFNGEERDEVAKVIAGSLVVLLNSDKYSDVKTERY